MDIFAKLRELDLPGGEYVVVGSGLLAALGLREANDLDIAVSENLVDHFRNAGFKEGYRHGKLFLISDDVDVITVLNWEDFPVTALEVIRDAQIIDGFPFMSFEHIIAFKKALGREKDFRDIELLEKYLNRKIHKMNLHEGPFNKIRSGEKKTELRLNDEKRQKIRVGDRVIFSKRPDLMEKVEVEIIGLESLSSFSEMYQTLRSTYSDYTEDEFVKSMYEYYSPEDEKKYGTLIISFEVIRQKGCLL